MVEKHGISVVLGASPNPSRASHMAVQRLSDRGMPVRAIGIREGEIGHVKIETDRPEIQNVETLTLYIGQKNMADWEDYALGLKPKRIIFNPGTENLELEAKARSAGIQFERACTLVLLSNNSY